MVEEKGKELLDYLEKEANSIPGIEKITQATGLKPSLILIGSIAILTFFTAIGIGSRVLSTLVGVAFPVF